MGIDWLSLSLTISKSISILKVRRLFSSFSFSLAFLIVCNSFCVTPLPPVSEKDIMRYDEHQFRCLAIRSISKEGGVWTHKPSMLAIPNSPWLHISIICTGFVCNTATCSQGMIKHWTLLGYVFVQLQYVYCSQALQFKSNLMQLIHKN